MMTRVRTESWILEKVLKFVQLFSRPGKVWKIEMKSAKEWKSLELFFKDTTSVYKWIFLLFLSNLIYPCSYVCSTPQKKLLFLRFKVSIDRKKIDGKRSGKSLEFWIQKSVRTLDDLSNSDQGFTPPPPTPTPQYPYDSWCCLFIVFT